MLRSHASRLFLTAALSLLLSNVSVASKDFGSRPHILMLLADDFGWANVGFHRHDDGTAGSRQGLAEVHTPNLDQLASGGVILDRHYTFKICSPSRSSFQSGRLAVHVNTENAGVTSQNPLDSDSGYAGIPLNMTGLGIKMKAGGYKTSLVGKWDVGMATPGHTPRGRGYDSWTGYFQHANDYWNKGMGSIFKPTTTGEIDVCLNKLTDFSVENATHRGGIQDPSALDSSCQDSEASDPPCYIEHIFREHSLKVIQNHDPSEPLFHTHAFHLLHTPLEVPKSYLTKIDEIVKSKGGKAFDEKSRRLYSAMVLYLDETVGSLIEAIKKKGIWDQTLVVFSSDNGGPLYVPSGSNNYPLRGGKYSDFEGGIRTNAFLGGGWIPKPLRGTRHKGVVSIADWYATFSFLAGVSASDPLAEAAGLPPVDGIEQWNAILNGTDARQGVPLHVSANAILEWPWKLITGHQPYARYRTGSVYPNCSTAEHFLDEGPMFKALKFEGVSVPYAADNATEDRLVWTMDCGHGCLYNLEDDPNEAVDLAPDPAHVT